MISVTKFVSNLNALYSFYIFKGQLLFDELYNNIDINLYAS